MEHCLTGLSQAFREERLFCNTQLSQNYDAERSHLQLAKLLSKRHKSKIPKICLYRGA